MTGRLKYLLPKTRPELSKLGESVLQREKVSGTVTVDLNGTQLHTVSLDYIFRQRTAGWRSPSHDQRIVSRRTPTMDNGSQSASADLMSMITL